MHTLLIVVALSVGVWTTTMVDGFANKELCDTFVKRLKADKPEVITETYYYCIEVKNEGLTSQKHKPKGLGERI